MNITAVTPLGLAVPGQQSTSRARPATAPGCPTTATARGPASTSASHRACSRPEGAAGGSTSGPIVSRDNSVIGSAAICRSRAGAGYLGHSEVWTWTGMRSYISSWRPRAAIGGMTCATLKEPRSSAAKRISPWSPRARTRRATSRRPPLTTCWGIRSDASSRLLQRTCGTADQYCAPTVLGTVP